MYISKNQNKIETFIYCNSIYNIINKTMSLFTTAITDIKTIHPHHEILNKYKQYMLDIIFNSTKEMNFMEIHKNIEQQFLENKQYIIKLMFSDNKNIYVFVDYLININYFKNMFDGYVFNNVIVEVIVDKMIDNHEIVNNIINGNNNLEITTYSEMYNYICIMDYLCEYSISKKGDKQ